MTILGRFTETDGGYAGPIHTLTLDVDLRLVATGAQGANMPSHRVLAGDVECGAAWPSDDESVILNVRLDDPSWPEMLKARLVRGRDDELLLVWRRAPPPDPRTP